MSKRITPTLAQRVEIGARLRRKETRAQIARAMGLGLEIVGRVAPARRVDGAEVAARAARGESIQAIAAAMGWPKNTIYIYCRRHGIEGRFDPELRGGPGLPRLHKTPGAHQTPLSLRLRQLRCGANLTARKVAPIAGMGYSAYRAMEAGRVRPQAQTLARLARFYKVPLAELLALAPQSGGLAQRGGSAASLDELAAALGLPQDR